MSAIVPAPPAMEQGNAAALPLPDSPRSAAMRKDGFDPAEFPSQDFLETVSSTGAVDGSIEEVDSVSVKTEAMSLVSESKEDKDTGMDDHVKPEGSNELRGVDHFDKKHNGDVIAYYFTRGTRSRTSSPIQENRTYQLAVGSDLWVKVKSNDGPDYVFEVDSAALAAHSPVFSTMAYDTHTRGNQEEWVWVLDNDSIQGLSVMFSLLHLDTRSRMFNQEPDATEVYNVMRVFAKYEIPKAAFFSWTKKWIGGFRKGLAHTTLSKAERLYTAHKLGDFKSLKSCIRHVALELEINADGSIRLANGEIVSEALPMTGDVVNNLLAIRMADLQALLPPFQEALDFFMVAGNADANKFCKSIDAHGPCNQKLLGSLLQNLIQQQLYPVPTVDSYKGSVGSLAEKISKMDVHGLILPGLEPHKQRHGNCKLGQDSVAKKIIKNEAYIPLSEDLVEHMYRAAKELGVNRAEQSDFHDYKDMFNKWKDCGVSWLSEEDTGVFDARDDVSSSAKASQ